MRGWNSISNKLLLENDDFIWKEVDKNFDVTSPLMPLNFQHFKQFKWYA